MYCNPLFYLEFRHHVWAKLRTSQLSMYFLDFFKKMYPLTNIITRHMNETKLNILFSQAQGEVPESQDLRVVSGF